MDLATPRNAPAAHMHGYLSRDGMPPGELLGAGRAEIAGYGGELIEGTVGAGSAAAFALDHDLTNDDVTA